MRTLLVAASLLALAGPQSQPQVIRSGVAYVTTDLAVGNARGQFVANPGKGDFDVYEDGVKRAIVTFVVSRGGRVLNEPPPPAARQEGILLPPARPANDSSGRVLLIFIDDLHISPRHPPRVRDLVKQIATELVHEADLFGIVSRGHSSIPIAITRDRTRPDKPSKP